GIGLQYAAAGDAVGAHAVQDRLRETGLPGKLRIGVQRVAVAAEAIDQRLVRTRRDVDDPVGRPARHLVRFGLTFGWAAKAAVTARKTRSHQRGELLAALVLQHGLVPDHGALVLALIEDVEHGRVGRDPGRARQRLVEGDVTLAVDHHHAVEIHLAGTGAPRRHRGEGRHDLERPRGKGAFVD